VKTILLDSNLILQGLIDEGDFHYRFIALWKTLQSSQLQGYITELDLAKLQGQLKQEIGHEASEQLLAAFGRVLAVWSGDRSFSVDVIVTEDPQSFNTWDVPKLSVADFLKRYELNSLLKQSSEAIPPLTQVPVLLDHNPNKGVTTILLMLPFLLELWMNREHLTGMLAAIANTGDQPEDETLLKSGLSAYFATEATNAVKPLLVSALAPVERSPSAQLLFADLPGIDIWIENDLSLDVQLDRQGNAVVVRLWIPEHLASEKGAVAAAIYQTHDNAHDNHENGNLAIAQVITADGGLLIAANPSEANAHSTSTPLEADGQLIAVVQQSPGGSLMAWLKAHSQNPTNNEGSTGDQSNLLASPFQSSATHAALVAVRSVDRYPFPGVPSSVAPSQDGVEIRVEVEPDGTHTVTVNPLMAFPGAPSGRVDQPDLLEGDRPPTPEEQLPVTTPNFGVDYDNSWVLNGGSVLIPDDVQSPTPSPGSESVPGEMGDRLTPFFVEPSYAIVQIATQNPTGVIYPDVLLGRQGTNTSDVTADELLTNDVSTSNPISHAALTISSRTLNEMEFGEMGLTQATQSTSQPNFAVIAGSPNFATLPSHSGIPSNAGLSTIPISGI
jgi:hypothetical protein